jgi:hypothetical protein
MDQSKEMELNYIPKSRVYYYIGVFLATCGIMLFVSLFMLGAIINNAGALKTYAASLAVCILLVPAGVTIFFIRKKRTAALEYSTMIILRAVLFFTMMLYASAKLVNGQLNVFYYALDTRLNDLDDIFLVWAFYGKSSICQVLLGALELLPALLILFRRTTFVGALLMLPVGANILMINTLYHVSPFTLTESILLVLFNVYVLYSYKNQIRNFLKTLHAESPLITHKPYFSKLIFRLKIALLCLVGLLLIKPVLAKKLNKNIRPVTGGYELVNLKRNNIVINLDSTRANYYKKIYFERSWVSGFATDRKNRSQNIRVAFFAKDSLKIANNLGSWDMYLEDTSSVFKGTYELPNDSTLIMKGKQSGNAIEATYKKLTLKEYDYWW